MQIIFALWLTRKMEGIKSSWVCDLERLQGEYVPPAAQLQYDEQAGRGGRRGRRVRVHVQGSRER